MARSGVAGALALVVTMSVAVETHAQRSIPAGAQPPVAPSGSTVEGQEVEGRITALDEPARTIRLDNGNEYVVPDAMTLDWGAIRTGATIRMRYSTNEGRNVVTALRMVFP